MEPVVAIRNGRTDVYRRVEPLDLRQQPTERIGHGKHLSCPSSWAT